MRREDLEERLDTEVTVTLFDGSEYTGVMSMMRYSKAIVR